MCTGIDSVNVRGAKRRLAAVNVRQGRMKKPLHEGLGGGGLLDLGGLDGGGVWHQDTSDGSSSRSVGPRISCQLIGLPDAMADFAWP